MIGGLDLSASEPSLPLAAQPSIFGFIERIGAVGENSVALWPFAYRAAQSSRFQQCPSLPSASYYG